MNLRFCLSMLFVIGACSGTHVPDRPVLALAQEVERLSGAGNYWPGFDPMAVPLAIYDGQMSYLFRHPMVPDGFIPEAGAGSEVFIYKGRHPAIIANSSADIGGTTTATLLIHDIDPDKSIAMMTGVAIHEAFHVYQREHHPGWSANEGDLFVYPFEDPELLALRRLETEALRRALYELDAKDSECWTGQALARREERYAKMDASFAAYERGTELNEGLATYVQLKAEDRKTMTFPPNGFAATDVRTRAYVTGAAFALLFDRIRAEWPESFEANDQQNLDQALRSALMSNGRSSSDRCIFSDAEIAAVHETARNDVAGVIADQIERRSEFDVLKGWRVVVRASNVEPLWPEGFDPLNVERVQGGVIHGRFLRLSNESGYVETIDTGDTNIAALTEGFGPHPLFNGVRQVQIAGLAEPEIIAEDSRFTIQMPGLEANFERVSIRREEMEIVVHLKPKR